MKRLALLGALVAGTAQAAPAPVTGMWLTGGGDALIQIEPCGARLCGRIAKMVKPRADGWTVDRANHDPSLRGRAIEGLPVLLEFTAAGDHWAGRVYDPESGRSYRGEMIRKGESLDVKGCLGPFCRVQHWTAHR